MITDKEGIKALKRMNTHKCSDCGKIFQNFKGMNEHIQEYKHYKFDLLNEEELALFYA